MAEFSGRQWCDRFPTSKSLDDLVVPFRDHVAAFTDALMDAGARVTVSATYRPAERAYLMHWCCMIAKSGQDPEAVPAMEGVDIDWSCGGDVALARTNARAMVEGYGIAYPAALISRHTQRRAIDMTIAWTGTLAITDGNGNSRSIPEGNLTALVTAGATFGVVKLISDPPHWSDDGH